MFSGIAFEAVVALAGIVFLSICGGCAVGWVLKKVNELNAPQEVEE